MSQGGGNAWRELLPFAGGTYAAGKAAGTSVFYPGNFQDLAAAFSARSGFFFDPADDVLTLIRVTARVVVNAVQPAANFTCGLAPVTGWGGAAGAAPSITAIGAILSPVVFNNPAAAGPTRQVGAAVAVPPAGEYALVCVTDAVIAVNSNVDVVLSLQGR